MRNLILITPDEERIDEINIVNALFENGLERLHLRKHSYTTSHSRGYLSKIDARWHNRVVLTSHFELLTEFNVAGIHLNGFVRKDPDAWRRIEDISPASISTSFHTWEEMEQNAFPYGYAFVSPVFNSISKVGYKASIDLSRAIEVKQGLSARDGYCPQIIALGGVGTKQIDILKRFAFDGVAMLGAIWQSHDPVKTFLEANEEIKAGPDN